MKEFVRTGEGEVSHYNEVARSEAKFAELLGRVSRVQSSGDAWGVSDKWLDTPFDSVAQAEVYEHVGLRLVDGDVLQVGGTGLFALKAIVGGARAATLLSPSQGEVDLTKSVASELGLSDRLTALVGFGESIPFAESSFDVAVTEGCLHHMDVAAASQEFARVLRRDGRFGAFDPWRARMYGVGTKVFGKRDPSVGCIPLDSERVAGFHSSFQQTSIRRHGAVVRYPAVAANKLGIPVSRQAAHWLTEWDDVVFGRFGWAQRNGSSAALLAVK
ncbi:class I SAM-dependent methyltransferase [Nocardioides sp. AX2bis]|uniref:class I SAM-dependent methyltransferase n=1 Tax=Nocardioides sp. AX2bis TaxID=2653157 RepID=UPI00135C4370|nr:methyltransferase domain-containing protein [Nocardioides sp. AX2bis]